jgi:cation:H+ antiporter
MVVVGLSVAAGLLLLALAPERLVAGSSGLADRWGVSRVVIGAVVIGFGTSAPELLVSGLAAVRGEPEVGIGNVIGSNMANLGLIVAAAALVGHLAVPAGLLRRELPLTLAATAAFALAVQGGLTRPEGALLLAGLVAVLWTLTRPAPPARPTRAAGPAGPAGPAAGEGQDEQDELAVAVDEFLVDEVTQPSRRLVAEAAVGLVGTLVGAQLLVTGAVEIAADLNLSGGFVGMTIVALGTSLPELVTAVTAARAGEDQLILGNVLGSNIFNSLAVAAVVGLASPQPVTDPAITVGAVGLMLAITALAAVAMTRRRRLTRGEAVALLASYVACMPLLAV